jgi:ppGpp synthetase/RelA/SpoT-type nucleotidyltranferase
MPYMSDAHLLRLQQEYRDIEPVAAALAQLMVRELEAVLRAADISLAVPIESRVKTWNSIEQKFLRAGAHLGAFRRFSGATLSELSDLIGVRVIVLFARDIERVGTAIAETFRVLEADDKSRQHGVDQFGYTSIHYDVTVPREWAVIPSVRAFDRFCAEIQVRTLAQHMWAAASHELQYKVEQSVPDEVRRSIHRIASLLEMVDAEYERLLIERQEYRSKIESDDTDSRLNTDILRAVLDKRLPRTNRAGWEPYSMLVWELSKLGIVRRSDLEGLVSRRLPAALEEDRKIVERDEGASTTSTVRDHFFTHTGLLNIMLEKEFGQGFHSIIFEKVEAELKASEQERTDRGLTSR